MDDAGVKKRKVRKGTHSCWECRRRKIRCHFASSDDRVCTGCRTRGTNCTSQELIDDKEHVRLPPERRLAHRLSRLEDMMERLVERMAPPGEQEEQLQQQQQQPAQLMSPAASSEVSRPGSDGQMRTPESTVGYMGTGSGSGTESSGLMSWSTAVSMSTPLGSELGSCTAKAGGGGAGGPCANSKSLDVLRKKLYALLPSQRDADTIYNASPGNLFIVFLLYPAHEVSSGRSEHKNVSDQGFRLPGPDAHPVILAKSLLQLTGCLQHVPPNFDASILQADRPVTDLADEWSTAASNLVCSNDELIGCADGVEVLLLQVFYQMNSGNLRKAWLTTRRAMSLAQLIGMDRKGAVPMKSCCDPTSVLKRPTVAYIWYRINFIDRYLSMLLGLPCGSRDDSFAAVLGDTPMEKLERVHIVMTGRIVDRNVSRSSCEKSYAVTQAIDCELRHVAEQMGADWWKIPVLDLQSSESMQEQVNKWLTLMLQLHHYSIVILLHLPYMLRDPSGRRWDYGDSKQSCLHASREVLIRFIRFRSINSKAVSCRHVDYCAIMASMTLILGYLGRRPGTGGHAEMNATRERDRLLALATRSKMEQLAELNNDKLSSEGAEIIRQLLPIIDTGASGAAQNALDRCLHLNVPYLGTVNINPPPMDVPEDSTTGTGGESSPMMGSDLVRPGVADYLSTSGTPPGTGFDSVGPLNPSMYLTLDPGFVGLDPNMTMDFGQGSGSGSGGGSGMDVQHQSNVQSQSQQQQQQQQQQGGNFYGGEDGVNLPGLTADAEDWLLQGVDTTYWSLLNGGFVQGS